MDQGICRGRTRWPGFLNRPVVPPELDVEQRVALKAVVVGFALTSGHQAVQLELEGDSDSAISAAFPRQMRSRHTDPLIVIRADSPAHRGDPLKAYLPTPSLNRRLVDLPRHSPGFNAGKPSEAGCARKEPSTAASPSFRLAPKS